ncbi:hypothetical protein Q3A66_19260 [Hymenobacter sp. BT770]|uniref:hypothetical protein n=1 Tax=Hymenobacter sp. BT770 TaxID=2886942 RepID=UPI001D126225|nr:hypothetical protein [Hymenobacter sp. BT770]MCC3155165.1 hypothetical protein [Hymenobacter sp. BT770]MDO3417213.1 hypothetical protein [Hymenobacter sp. BT770]
MNSPAFKSNSSPSYQRPTARTTWPTLRLSRKERPSGYAVAQLKTEASALLGDTLTEAAGLARNPVEMDTYAGSF